jgi:hypothetical protein
LVMESPPGLENLGYPRVHSTGAMIRMKKKSQNKDRAVTKIYKQIMNNDAATWFYIR